MTDISQNSNEVNSEGVMDMYFEVLGSKEDQLSNYIMPNGALDWFGRTIRGSEKIWQYLRYHVLSEYGHSNFSVAKTCTPIEHKPTHKKTMEMPQTQTNLKKKKTKVPPSLSLRVPTSAGDGIEQETEILPASVTVASDTINNEGSPSTDCDSSDGSCEIQPKRIKRTNSSCVTKCSAAHSAGLSEEFDPILYTPLQYIEASGELQAHDPNLMYLHRDVRLRLSFRRRITDGQIFFALIIYERKTTAIQSNLLCRNLLNEFESTTEEMEIESEIERDISSIGFVNTTSNNPIDSSVTTTEDITIVSLRTPSKLSTTPPATPKRKPRSMRAISGLRQLTVCTESTRKRKVARNLRL